jgi:NSS family neurotransmitter:Na+ symporter
MRRADSDSELHMTSALGYRAWRLLIRYVAPLGVALVFLRAVGVL